MEKLQKSLSDNHIKEICGWITKAGELPLISGELTSKLTPEVLKSWLSDSKETLVKYKGDKIIGLATLSCSEAEMNDDEVELCHCIVHPDYRRLYNGTVLISKLMSEAKKNGYNFVIGRVNVHNIMGHGLLAFLNWKPAPKNYSNDSTVVWYRKQLN